MVRRWISFFVILAFVVTTMPAISHAALHTASMPAHQKMSTDNQMPDCHSAEMAKAAHSDQTNKTQPAKDNCCGSDCQCVKGTCNGLSKVLGASGLAIFLPVVQLEKSLAREHFLLSNLQYHIKRPPRL